jgi:hypothetical protein
MGQGLKELYFHQDLLQPGVIISDGDSLASKVAESDTIEDVFHEQDHPFAAPAQLLFHDKKPVEVVLGERRT